MEEVKWVQTIHNKSEHYYTKAYKLSKERKLSKAKLNLDKAISLNKTHIEAKNLMGLICFEMGEVGSALEYWILSTAYHKSNNPATGYIDTIQSKPKQLENYKEAINLHNRALDYLKNGNSDVAIIQLKKALHLNPKLVEARNLLALAYIKQEEYTLAVEQINAVFKIDHLNEKALSYLAEIESKKQQGGNNKEYTISNINKQSALSANTPQMIVNKSKIVRRQLLYLCLGMVCSALVSEWIIVPSKLETLNADLASVKASHTKQEQTLLELTKQYEAQIESLGADNLRLEGEYSLLKEELLMNQKEQGFLAYENCMNKWDWVGAADALTTIPESTLTDEERNQYEKDKEASYRRAGEIVYYEAYQKFLNQSYDEADRLFDKTLIYTKDENIAANTLYYKGEIAEEKNDLGKAIELYKRIMTVYPDTHMANKAKNKVTSLE